MFIKIDQDVLWLEYLFTSSSIKRHLFCLHSLPCCWGEILRELSLEIWKIAMFEYLLIIEMEVLIFQILFKLQQVLTIFWKRQYINKGHLNSTHITYCKFRCHHCNSSLAHNVKVNPQCSSLHHNNGQTSWCKSQTWPLLWSLLF